MNWEVLYLAIEIAGGGLAVAFWIVRGFWKGDVRLTAIEKEMASLREGLGEIKKELSNIRGMVELAVPRKVIRFGDAVGRDHGEL